MLFLQDNIGVYWVNMQVFDHRGELVTGDQSLGVWRCTEGQTATGYPHGTPGMSNKHQELDCLTNRLPDMNRTIVKERKQI